MANDTYPGVYIEELPSSVRSITGVDTAITAFVGRTQRGPVNEPTRINNLGDFERIFGGLWAESPLTYAVNDFFNNGGNAALIVRLFSPLFPTEVARAAAETQARNEATAAVAAIEAVVAQPQARLAQGGLVLEAKSAGIWGNSLQARITHEDADSFTLIIQDGITGKIETHRRLTVQPSDKRFVTEVLRNESALVLAATVPWARPAAHGPVDRGKEFDTPGAFSAPNTAGGSAGSDGNVLGTADYRGRPADKTGIYALEKADLFNLLCLPPPSVGGDLPSDVYVRAAEYCQNRRAFY